MVVPGPRESSPQGHGWGKSGARVRPQSMPAMRCRRHAALYRHHWPTATPLTPAAPNPPPQPYSHPPPAPVPPEAVGRAREPPARAVACRLDSRGGRGGGDGDAGVWAGAHRTQGRQGGLAAPHAARLHQLLEGGELRGGGWGGGWGGVGWGGVGWGVWCVCGVGWGWWVVGGGGGGGGGHAQCRIWWVTPGWFAGLAPEARQARGQRRSHGPTTAIPPSLPLPCPRARLALSFSISRTQSSANCQKVAKQTGRMGREWERGERARGLGGRGRGQRTRPWQHSSQGAPPPAALLPNRSQPGTPPVGKDQLGLTHYSPCPADNPTHALPT